jgi:hypothetical protein
MPRARKKGPNAIDAHVGRLDHAARRVDHLDHSSGPVVRGPAK